MYRLGGSLPSRRYVYYAKPDKIIDGDTVDLVIDLGMHSFYVINWMEEAKNLSISEYFLVIRTDKDPDAFGRYLAIIWRMDGRCLNDDLLTEELAVPYAR